MDVQWLRDWVRIVAGILWLIVTLVVAVVFFFLWIFTSTGFHALGRLFSEKLRPALSTAHTQIAVARDMTSRLPGNTPLPEGEVRPRRARRGLPIPFRR